MRYMKIFGIVLVLTLIVTALTIPVTIAAPSEAAAYASYKYFYDTLQSIVDAYGIGQNYAANASEANPDYWGLYYHGVTYAELLDFDNDGFPELVYFYNDGTMIRPLCLAHDFITGNAGQFYHGFSGTNGGFGDWVDLATCGNGVKYLRYSSIEWGGADGPEYIMSESYYSLTNGKWTGALSRRHDRNYDYSNWSDSGYEAQDFNWSVNGVLVSKQEYDNAPVTLGIVGTRSFDNEDNSSTVSSVLTELKLRSAPSARTVYPTASTVFVNGKDTAFEAYNIGGYNYFKLRDLATVLNGTQKQFSIGYDSSTKAITLTSGQPYTTVGGEMVQGDGKPKTAMLTPSRIYFDGRELNLLVYNIGGNNFFKLRDLMETVDVFVGYDNETKAITLDTSRGYLCAARIRGAAIINVDTQTRNSDHV